MELRPEKPGDEGAIRELTRVAFDGHPHSDGSEPAIIDRLREAGALLVSLVSVEGGRIVGHIAFSPVTWSGQGRWVGLGPVSVAPDLQARGIGGKLVREGLKRIADLGFHGCVVMGDPAYYGRFGFEVDPRLTYPGVPPEYFMRLAFQPVEGDGPVTYNPAFG